MREQADSVQEDRYHFQRNFISQSLENPAYFFFFFYCRTYSLTPPPSMNVNTIWLQPGRGWGLTCFQTLNSICHRHSGRLKWSNLC